MQSKSFHLPYFTFRLIQIIFRSGMMKLEKSENVSFYLNLETYEINREQHPTNAILLPMHPKMILRQPQTKTKNLKKS